MKNYVVTSIIPGSGVDYGFLRSLLKYCQYNKSELVILECDFNYIGDITDNGYHEAVKEELQQYLSKGNIFNNSLRTSSFQPKVNVIDPLGSMEALASHEGNLIVPFPRHRFKSVARSLKHSRFPRGIWCTGTVSQPYYKPSKGGRIAACYHTLGALSVQILDNDRFEIRQLQYDGEGFYDLTNYYTPTAVSKTNDAVIGLSLGDLHPPFLCPHVKAKTLDLISAIKPKHIIYHDTFDACSISHHVAHKKITQALIIHEVPSLRSELKLTADLLKEYQSAAPAGTEHHIVKSNHDEHLERYLDEFRFKEDNMNLELALELAAQWFRYERGGSPMGPLEYGLKLTAELKNFKFHERDHKLALAGNEVLNHGDHAANGAGPSTKSNGLAFSGNLVTGHTHSPEIGPFNNFVNGTSTKLSLPYTNDSGTSGWLNTHTLIYKNGKKTHYHVVP